MTPIYSMKKNIEFIFKNPEMYFMKCTNCHVLFELIEKLALEI